MRYDGEHKLQTRERVLDAAAKAIRLSGPDKVGVAAVMADAGLTHGGFYAHFKSKDDLVVAAIEHMLVQARSRFAHETAGREPAEALRAYIDFYLSKKYRDARASGCPVAALASDSPRLHDEARAAHARGVQTMAARIAGLLRANGNADAHNLARSAVAELIGALALARIEPDAKQSDEVLAASKRALKRRLGIDALH